MTADQCRVVDFDGTPVRVRGAGELTETDLRSLRELVDTVRAAAAAERGWKTHRGHYFRHGPQGWTCIRCGIGNQDPDARCQAPDSSVPVSRRAPRQRQEQRARAAAAPVPALAAPAPKPPRPGWDLLERGICGRGHTIASVYELEIHADAIRCARCVDEARAEHV